MCREVLTFINAFRQNCIVAFRCIGGADRIGCFNFNQIVTFLMYLIMLILNLSQTDPAIGYFVLKVIKNYSPVTIVLIP